MHPLNPAQLAALDIVLYAVSWWLNSPKVVAKVRRAVHLKPFKNYDPFFPRVFLACLLAGNYVAFMLEKPWGYFAMGAVIALITFPAYYLRDKWPDLKKRKMEVSG